MLHSLTRNFHRTRRLMASVQVTIDDVPVEVDSSMTILQACQFAGKTVAHFCFHDRLSVAGNCRMCLVDVEKAPKPTASCAMTVAPGMNIRTTTERAYNAKGGVMEMLLANHPLDCPICDQGGECDLQDQSLLFGYSEGRFLEYKRAVEDKSFGPLISTIMTRCIHCTRCVRFSAEVAGQPVLGTTARGRETEIGTYVKKLLTSELSGNLVDLCPVGALTNAPYAFTARPWELRQIKSYDVMDPLAPAILINSRGPEVMRVLPRIHDDINEEWISDKTRHAFDGIKRQRINACLKRTPEGFEEISWVEALRIVNDKFKSVKPQEVAGLIGEQMDIEAITAYRDLFYSLGVENIDYRRVHNLEADFRTNYLFNSTVPGVEEADVLLVIGSNLRVEHPVLNARIRKSVVNNDLEVGIVGTADFQTYTHQHLGNTPKTLQQLLDGTHPFAEKLKNAKFPMVIVGTHTLQRTDADGILGLVKQLSDKYHVISEETNWNGLNFLHKNLGSIAALELGIRPTKGPQPKLVYLFGANEFKDDEIPEDAFVIYQGTHGDNAAYRADLILPGATYAEKTATYVNLDGRVLLGRLAISPPGQARSDWEIMRALSEVLGKTLPYDTVDDVRFRVAELAPHLIKYDYIEPYGFSGFTLRDLKDSVENTPITDYIDNFYMTDPISRASPLMAKCSAAFNPVKLTNFPAQDNYQQQSSDYNKISQNIQKWYNKVQFLSNAQIASTKRSKIGPSGTTLQQPVSPVFLKMICQNAPIGRQHL